MAENKSVNSRVEELKQSLKLQPHPTEGGFFVESFRSKSTYQLERGLRNCSAVIYYLLLGNDVSPWHKLKGDEYYCFYEGSPLNVHLIYPGSDKIAIVVLGRDVSQGQVFHVEIPAGTWVASYPSNPDSYTLIGNPTAPAFDYKDAVIAKASDLAHVQDPKKVQLFAKE